MPTIKRLDHIAIAVNDLGDALAFWEALGLHTDRIEEIPAEQAYVAFLPVGDGEIELVKPTSDTTGTAKFLAKRGEGMHHVCLEVEGLDELLTQLQAKGIQLINETPVTKPNGVRYAFIHPKSAHGVLVELYEKPA